MDKKFANITEFKTCVMNLDRAIEKDVWTTEKGSTALADRTPKHKGIWNIDKKHLSCIATDKYKIIQHREAFEQLTDVLSELGIKFKGVLRDDGDRVSSEIVFDGKLIKDDSKGVQLGVRIVNSYDKSHSLFGELWAYRLVCSNGMVLGKAVGDIRFSRWHMGTIDVRKEMRNFLKLAIQSDNRLNDLISEAMVDSVEWDLAKKILEKLVGVKKYRDLIQSELEVSGVKTRWDLYNAITNVATHGTDLTSGVREWLQFRAQKVLTTDIMELPVQEVI